MKIAFSASHLNVVADNDRIGVITNMSYGQVVTLLTEIKEVMSVRMWEDLMEEINGEKP